MGDSNYGGNGSIHWSIDHQNGKGLTIRKNDGERPKHGSRSNVHAKECLLMGRDEPDGDVEYFDVTLRFEAQQSPDPIEQLKKALEQAKSAQAKSVKGSFFVKFKVPATVNKRQRKSPGQKPWPDVRVQW
jgi:hypothetical protein